MIYDTFCFFNELELLEVRLNELDKVVDKFILVEAKRTFSNEPKPLYYGENKDRFERFNDRIIHIVIDEFPASKDAWGTYKYQKNCALSALQNCHPDDLILISDIDEIPRADKVLEAAKLLRHQKVPVPWKLLRPAMKFPACANIFHRLLRKYNPRIAKFEQDMFYYYLNYSNKDAPIWYGTRMVPYQDITILSEVRYSGRKIIRQGGWHFSYLGGAERVRKKIQSFSHQELNTPQNDDLQKLSKTIEEGKLFFNESTELQIVEINNSYPRYILDNLGKFDHLIKAE